MFGWAAYASWVVDCEFHHRVRTCERRTVGGAFVAIVEVLCFELEGKDDGARALKRIVLPLIRVRRRKKTQRRI